MSSFPAFLSERIKKMRLKHPGWGPSTILAELQSTKELANCALPSRSTIGLFLQEQQLSKSYEINSPLPVEPCKEAKRCHSIWQVDGKGNSQVKGVGPISLLNVKDVYSSAYISCFPARMKSMQGHPNKSDAWVLSIMVCPGLYKAIMQVCSTKTSVSRRSQRCSACG